MGTVKLENTSDAAIYLPVVETTPEGKPLFSNDLVIIPRAKREETTNETTGEKKVKVTVGSASIDEAAWAMVKGKRAVMTYLESGRLRVAGSSGPPSGSSPAPGGKTKG